MKKFTNSQLQGAYRYLKVSPSASDDEVKRVWRKRMAMCHPDINKNTNANEIAQRVNGAYEIIELIREGKASLISTRPVFSAPKPPPKRYGDTRFTEQEMEEAREAFKKKRAMRGKKPFDRGKLIEFYILLAVSGLVMLFFILNGAVYTLKRTGDWLEIVVPLFMMTFIIAAFVLYIRRSDAQGGEKRTRRKRQRRSSK